MANGTPSFITVIFSQWQTLPRPQFRYCNSAWYPFPPGAKCLTPPPSDFLRPTPPYRFTFPAPPFLENISPASFPPSLPRPADPLSPAFFNPVLLPPWVLRLFSEKRLLDSRTRRIASSKAPFFGICQFPGLCRPLTCLRDALQAPPPLSSTTEVSTGATA